MEGNKIFLVVLQERRYIILRYSDNGELDFAFSFVRFYSKKGKKSSEM